MKQFNHICSDVIKRRSILTFTYSLTIYHPINFLKSNVPFKFSKATVKSDAINLFIYLLMGP